MYYDKGCLAKYYYNLCFKIWNNDDFFIEQNMHVLILVFDPLQTAM